MVLYQFKKNWRKCYESMYVMAWYGMSNTWIYKIWFYDSSWIIDWKLKSWSRIYTNNVFTYLYLSWINHQLKRCKVMHKIICMLLFLKFIYVYFLVLAMLKAFHFSHPKTFMLTVPTHFALMKKKAFIPIA